jgi:hypothetical protein
MADVTIPSVTGGVVERHPGGRISCKVKAGTTIVGGKLVELTGAALGYEVQTGTLYGPAVLGVAMMDGNGDVEGKKVVTVATVGVWNLKASGAINAGDKVACAASGDVISVAGVQNISSPPVDFQVEQQLAVIGIALEDITNGNLGAILLRLGGSL